LQTSGAAVRFSQESLTAKGAKDAKEDWKFTDQIPAFSFPRRSTFR